MVQLARLQDFKQGWNSQVGPECGNNQTLKVGFWDQQQQQHQHEHEHEQQQQKQHFTYYYPDFKQTLNGMFLG